MPNIETLGNLLGLETSPYLLQHQHNPVHWLPWGEAAFGRARTERKAVLLSVGYAACHWCHVMAHECFEDAEIAALMNALFVNIKLDREERPDLDHIYQAALAMLGQPGGWPLTLFLTPDRVPFWGGTYFPRTARYGRPGFGEVLRQVSSAYQNNPEGVVRAAGTLRDGLQQLSETEAGGPVPLALIDRVAERLVREVDPFTGGLGDAPKFPQVPAFELLWRAWLRTGRAPFRTAVTTTLTQMSQGGIYDHLAGGFARYATDAEWLVPHFEKMLYDNAQLIGLLTLVWQGTGDPLYAARVDETVGWVLREMVVPEGGFASSIDADAEHEEGKFTVWTAAEIDACLGDEADWFKSLYGVEPGGNWEGSTILNRSHQPNLLTPVDEARLAVLRARLLAVRNRRPRPDWDDKVLADWNGLMIEALARAGQAFGRADWIAASVRAFDFVINAMTVNGRLHHSWRGGRAGPTGLLDDLAAVSLGALALHQATQNPMFLHHARCWVALADRHFWDVEKGGYFLTADDAEVTLVRTKSALDTATPNGNGMMLGALARLYHVTGETGYRERAEALIQVFSGAVGRNPLGFATLLHHVETLARPVVVVIVGTPGASDTEALRSVATAACLPDRVLMIVSPPNAFPTGHPAYGKALLDGQATAYVCTGPTCGAPLTEPSALAAILTMPPG